MGRGLLHLYQLSKQTQLLCGWRDCHHITFRQVSILWIQDLLKYGAPKLRTDRTLATVGKGVSEGDVPPQKWRKNVIFKVNSHNLVHSFALGAHKESGAPSLQKIKGLHTAFVPPTPHQTPPPPTPVCPLLI